jgi:hypothetical protein
MRLSLNRNILLALRLDNETLKRIINLQYEAIERYPLIATQSAVAYLILRKAVADKPAEEVAKEVAEMQHSWLRHLITTRIDPETDAKLAEVARLLGIVDGGKSFIASRLIIKYTPQTTIEDLILQFKKELFPHLP